MRGLKGLYPTMREKTRYILCQAPDADNIDTLETAVQQAVCHYIGVKGAGAAGVYVVRSHSKLPYVVLRCTAKYKDDVIQSLTFCTQKVVSQKTLGVLSDAVPTNLDPRLAKTGNSKHKVKLCKITTTK